MTGIQVNYLQLQETKRHNQAMEAAQIEQNRIAALNADIQKTKVDNDFVLGSKNLNIASENLSLGWYNAQNNYTLGVTNASNQLYNYQNQAAYNQASLEIQSAYNQAYINEIRTHNIVTETIQANSGRTTKDSVIRNSVLASQRVGDATTNAADQSRKTNAVVGGIINKVSGVVSAVGNTIKSVTNKIADYGNSKSSVDWSTIYV